MQLSSYAWAARIFGWWHGSRVSRRGPGHRLDRANARLRRTRIEFMDREGVAELGRDVRLFDCHIVIRGAGARLSLGERVRLRGVRIVVEDAGSRLEIGAGTTMTGAVLQAKEGGLVSFGRDCMVGSGVEVSNSDSHSLVEAASGRRLNPARDIRIGDHVWLGAGCWINKGARVGSGSTIAARSRVVGEVPPAVLAAGAPATVRRVGVSWDRRRLPA